MTASISRRLLFNTAFAQLAAVENQKAYPGEASNVAADSDGRVEPYTCLWPSTGDPDVEMDLADEAVDLMWDIAITAVAADVETVMALIDRVDAAFYRWEPVIGGLVVGPFRPPSGYEAQILPDRTVNPHRMFALLQYRTTITAS